MHALTPLALIALLFAAPAPAAPRPDAPTRFDPLAFFAGHTEGRGRLKIALRQTVEQTGKPTKRREWRIHEIAPGRYSGTLTDAVGGIAGETIGGRLRLDYRLKGGLRVTQWIEAAPGGRSAHNRLTVRRLGLPVAHLDETIRRTGP